jgi:hypothetical protein
VVAAVIGTAVVLGIAAPWREHGNGGAGSALAAVGPGPVLHAVIASDVPGESIVNLSTGAKRPVPQTLEYWYDAGRGLLRAVSTLNGVVEFDAVVPRNGPQPLLDPALTAFAGRYREALKRGQARRAGRGRFAGHSVVWLHFDYRQFGERVGVDARSYRPVVIEPLGRNGGPIAPTWVVRAIGTGQYVASDFRAARPVPHLSVSSHLEKIAPTKAARLVGWTPLWLGRSFGRLPLLQSQLQLLTHDPPEPRQTTKGVYFAYGRLADRIQLSESKDREQIYRLQLGGGPPTGTALLRRQRVVGRGPIKRECQAQVHTAGVWVTVEGWNESSTRCIDAARALVRVPG